MSTDTHGKHAVKVGGVAPAPSGKTEGRIVGKSGKVGARQHRPVSYDRGVQIAAAKVRVATDKKLGEKTPEWIVELSLQEKNAPTF